MIVTGQRLALQLASNIARRAHPIPRKHLMHAILIAQLTRDHFVSLNRFRALLSAYPRAKTDPASSYSGFATY
jgi:hypothetical protein